MSTRQERRRLIGELHQLIGYSRGQRLEPGTSFMIASTSTHEGVCLVGADALEKLLAAAIVELEEPTAEEVAQAKLEQEERTIRNRFCGVLRGDGAPCTLNRGHIGTKHSYCGTEWDAPGTEWEAPPGRVKP